MENLLPESTAAPELILAVGQAFRQPFSWSKLLYTVLLFLACMVVMKVLLSILERTIQRLEVERSLHTFIKSGTKVLLWFLTIIIVAGYLGIEVSSLVAVLGVAGLAVSLAIQGTLSNLAGGIMLLTSKPFAVGDYIEAGGVSGTVHDIGMVYTQLKTIDNKVTFVPNGEISKDKIINYTDQEQRRVDLKFSVSYEADPELVKRVIQEVIGAHPKALFTPEPFVRTCELGESSVTFQVRVWCATADYWDLYYDLLEQVRAAFDRTGIELTYNHLNVHLVEDRTKDGIDRPGR